ncbi:hypothetical protein B0T21DRAFT_87936 [Apiosordaria backusii]|uniref:Uncharacterized protein n=1 Tax=Apiosordaria backusii TaxID=314023 RepID=A0AA40K3B2_9PEZI|nr:hypothetical protein B0T21DRAFT_87936 [Apiosordaria backusii]
MAPQTSSSCPSSTPSELPKASRSSARDKSKDISPSLFDYAGLPPNKPRAKPKDKSHLLVESDVLALYKSNLKSGDTSNPLLDSVLHKSHVQSKDIPASLFDFDPEVLPLYTSNGNSNNVDTQSSHPVTTIDHRHIKRHSMSQMHLSPDLERIWNAISRLHNGVVFTIGVVDLDQLESMKQMKDSEMKKHNPAMSSLTFTTPGKLQVELDEVTRHPESSMQGLNQLAVRTKKTEAPCSRSTDMALNLLTSATVKSVTYKISKAVRELLIRPCVEGRIDTLEIGSQSTFCKHPAYLTSGTTDRKTFERTP